MDGAFARYILVPDIRLHRVPTGVSYDEAALTEPLACAVHAVVRNARIEPGDSVVILGPGPLGLLALQVAKTQGAGRIIISGLSADNRRLDVARNLGADEVVNVEAEDLVEIVGRATNGKGADMVFEMSGSAQGVKQALEITRRKGQLVLVGILSSPVDLDLNKVVLKELTVQGDFAHNWADWEQALHLISAKKALVKPLITHKFPITDWKTGLDLFEQKKGIGVILTPVD